MINSYIRRQRQTGEICIFIQALPLTVLQNDDVQANLLMQQLGFRPTEGWEYIDRLSAEVLIQTALYRDLCYRRVRMSTSLAIELKNQFFSLFEDRSRYLTNAEFTINRDEVIDFALANIYTWDSLTDAVYDTGVVCINGSHIGVLWIQDND